MRLADYVMQFLENLGVGHIFMLSGGGMMYLADALGHSRMEYVCCHHEQAAGIAAQAYAMVKNGLGVCMVTTGPGGTNALTAAGAAYMDSTPVLFLSGQVKTDDFAGMRKVRQFGAQENDIVAMVAPVTKYAVTVKEAERIRYDLEKAVFFAMHGRRGPVWLDIPLDVQNADICPQKLAGFDQEEVEAADIAAERQPDKEAVDRAVGQLLTALKKAKRPLFLIGHGVAAADAEGLFCAVQKKMHIPVISTWRAVGIMDSADADYFGSPGLQARRYANLITQGADVLIVIGSRMDNMITAFHEEHFAFRAEKFVVDIDRDEISKLAMAKVTPIVCSADYFLERLLTRMRQGSLPEYREWVSFCRIMKERYPLSAEKQDYREEQVDLYQMAEEVSAYCGRQDVLVVSSTSRCNTAGYLAFAHRKGQRVVSSMGFGSMGFALPSVVGAWFASGKHRVVMLEGDGSFQLNLQELQTVVHHKMDAKMFVFSNQGYAAIAAMQDRNFNGFHIGCCEDSGVTMPNLGKIAAAYGIPYYLAKNQEEAADRVKRTMECAGPVICEFAGSLAFDEIPKCISFLDEEGRRVSAPLENPYPFLSEREMQSIYQDFEEERS